MNGDTTWADRLLGADWRDDPITRDAVEGMSAPQLEAPPPPTPRGRRLGAVPACWSWEFDPTTPPGTSVEEGRRLALWQDGRCAVCGCGDAATEDHDHASGLTRGYLCRACNLGEAMSGLRVFSLYRWRHPTAILGLSIPYSGAYSIDPLTS